MKKVITVLISILVLAAGAAMAQVTDSAAHDLEIKIPQVVQIRITDGVSTAAVANPIVSFDYSADQAGYMAAVEGTGSLAPTDTATFGDLIVMSNKGGWSVSVQSAALQFTDDGVTFVPATNATHGLELADVTVNLTGGWDASAGAYNGMSFPLSVTPYTINDSATTLKTSGWASLAIDGAKYALAVEGDEEPGTYSSVVTYTLTAP